MPSAALPERRWVRGYADGREHLHDALGRLDQRLRLAVARHRLAPSAGGLDDLRGLYISEAEIDALVHEEEAPGGPGPAALVQALEEAGERLEERTARALEDGVHLPLVALARRFALTDFDLEALLVCLAPEIGPGYEKLYAYLHDDVTRKRPSPGLILALLCEEPEERLDRRARFAADAPLLGHRLLLRADGAGDEPGLLSRPLVMDERIVGYLLGIDAVDERIAPFTHVVRPLAASEGPASVSPAGGEAPRRLVFWGPAGTGKRAAAEAASTRAGRALLVVDVPDLLARAGDLRAAGERIVREAALRPADVYLDGAEALLDEAAPAGAARDLFRSLDAAPAAVVVGSLRPWPPLASGEEGAYRRVAFAPPAAEERLDLWHRLVRERRLELAPDADLGAVAERFDFPPASIRLALSEAAQEAAARVGPISADDLARACRAQRSGGLAALAREVTPLYTWEDIVLPADRLAQLREVSAHARYRRQVFETWGLERKIARGRGLSVLFVGPSGTGKTMAAEILAADLGLDLYTVDLASVVSKYIGETEKNMARIFEQAEKSRALLFFDEADALFGKRSAVRDSHDRYANIEINYLLQRMEDHDGTVILASNLRRNIDPAFTRRLRFVVEFPLPGEADRRRIWRRLFPEPLPVAADVDLDFLARKFKITGGSIKNIVLHAAFLAAADGAPVAMEHLVRATGRELQKTGKLRVRGDFEQYFDLVREEAP